MKRMSAVLAMCVVQLCAAGVASAQTSTTQTTQSTTKPPPAPIAGRAPLGVTVIEMEAVVLGWSVKKDLLGKAVTNDKNERIGKVDDLIITPSADVKMPHASFAVIGVGGFLGIGTKDVVIPMEQIKLQGNRLVLAGASKEALKALPEFKYARK
jgi:sporulation protein YlmC with PRC-barrel domain